MRSVPVYRVTLGLLQGATLAFLYFAYDNRSWPATNGEIFAPLLMVALFTPLLISQALNRTRLTTLLYWAAAASLLSAALAFYDIWRAWPFDWVFENGSPAGEWQPHILPSWSFGIALAAILFVGHALIVSADADRKVIAAYPTYFDAAWEQGVQLALTVVFVGLFWGLLWLGAGLFELVKIDFLSRLFRRHWFWIPATTLAVAVALHVTDARVGLVRGTRILALTLLSLLLPLMTVLIIGFLGALAVKGLEPLWDTRHAAALLLIATGVILVLINAAYQDGPRDRHVASALRISASVAAVLPVPLVALAAYALLLRVDQYGWTADRIIAAAAVFVAASHAIGYAWAAVARPWLRPIERWNVYCAFVSLAVLLALFSPLADPARLSVDDQMARFTNRTIPADKLDLAYLRWDAGRYGKAALETLAARQGEGDAQLRVSASQLLEAKSRFTQVEAPHPLASNLIIHAPDGKLPDSFLAQDWAGQKDFTLPTCLRLATIAKCDVVVKDVKGDGSPQIIIVQGNAVTGFDQDATGVWRLSARWTSQCRDTTEALRAGQFTAAAPEPASWPDLEVAGQRLRLAPPNVVSSACPKS